MAPRGEADFVTDIAAPLPLQVICELVGAPLEDRDWIFDLSNKLVGYDDPEFRRSPEEGHAGRRGRSTRTRTRWPRAAASSPPTTS